MQNKSLFFSSIKAPRNKIIVKKIHTPAELEQRSGLIYLPQVSVSSKLNSVYLVVSIGSDIKEKGFVNPNNPYAYTNRKKGHVNKSEIIKCSKNLIEGKSKVMLSFTPIADEIRVTKDDDKDKNNNEYDLYYSINPYDITLILNS